MRDFSPQELVEHRQRIYERASGQSVETFVADHWTLEYDLAHCGLAREVWIAADLAKADDRISAGKTTRKAVVREALKSYSEMAEQTTATDELASRVYARYFRGSAISKATAAQHLAWVLDVRQRRGCFVPERARTALPAYLVNAIDHVTRSHSQSPSGQGAPRDE
jgi:putative ATP-dependent endonuclease of OLD family